MEASAAVGSYDYTRYCRWMAQTASKKYDAVVVGSGPNGLAAAIILARAGRSVVVLEAKATPGGGARTEELTLPGFHHDTCSAVYPMAVGSPFFREMPLHRHGLEWIHPPAALAHPFDDRAAAVLYRSLDDTARTLGADGERYRELMASWIPQWNDFSEDILGPLRIPKHPLRLAFFGVHAIRSASALARAQFREAAARGLFAGLAAHSFLPLTQAPSAAIGLVLGLAGHAVGWPIPRGGAGAISAAMVSYLRSLGGEVLVDREVRTANELPSARAVLFDLTPPPFVRIAGSSLSTSYVRRLERFRYGPGVYKMDWALSGPIPWRDPECAKAGTVHLGGTLEEMEVSEAAPWKGEVPARPYTLLAQPSLFDDSRAPAGQHTVWAYCHVPRGSTADLSKILEDQIERFAPGFRSRILARAVRTPAQMEAHNANYVGGDISGGIADFRQVFFRPLIKTDPYRTSRSDWYLCSASTPPGTGVHGMCGVFAALSALKNSLR